MISETMWAPSLFWHSLLAVFLGTVVLSLLLRKFPRRKVVGWFSLWAMALLPLLAVNWWTNLGGQPAGPAEAYPIDPEMPHYLTLGVIIAVMALLLIAAMMKMRKARPPVSEAGA